MNIEEHNQRKPLKRATLQQAHCISNTTMETTTAQVTDTEKEMVALQETTIVMDNDKEELQRGTRRPREDDSLDSHYDNDHVRKKSSLDYHDSKTEGAYFISTTYDMINRCDNQCPEIACWSPDGKTVLIKDQTAFASKVLPDYFTSKYESFTRQLSFYGFRKMQARNHGKKSKKTQKCASFINDKFQREKPDLLKFIKRTTNHGINALKQSEEDKIYMEEQKKEVQVLKELVKNQKKEIDYLRILSMEMKTQLAGVVQQVEVLKKDSVLYAASLAAGSGRSGRRSYNLPPPVSQQQRASNPAEVTIQQTQPVQVQTVQAVQAVPAPASRSYSSGRTTSSESKISTLVAALEADSTAANVSQFQTAPGTPNPFFTHFQRIPSNDLRTNSFLRTLSGGQFPDNWVLPGGFGGDKIAFQVVEADPNTLATNGLTSTGLSTIPMATIAQQVHAQSTRPELSQVNANNLDMLSTFGKSKNLGSASNADDEK